MAVCGRARESASPKQLQKILFEDMGLKPTKKTKTGSYTTNAAALQVLRDRSYGNDRLVSFLMRCCCIVRRISLSRLCRR